MGQRQKASSGSIVESRWFLGIALAVSLAALVIATSIALTVEQFGWDPDITLWIQKFSLGKARFARGWLFWMGGVGVAGVVLVAMAGLLWLRSLRIESAFVALTAIPNFFNFALRDMIGRDRPTMDLVEVIGGPQGFSFPSGHALHVLFFYGFLLYLAAMLLSNRRLLRTLMVLGAIYLPFSGLWLIYDGRHWFTDVMGGYIYGTFYLSVWIAAYRWTKHQMEERERFRLLYDLLRINWPFAYRPPGQPGGAKDPDG